MCSGTFSPFEYDAMTFQNKRVTKLLYRYYLRGPMFENSLSIIMLNSYIKSIEIRTKFLTSCFPNAPPPLHTTMDRVELRDVEVAVQVRERPER